MQRTVYLPLAASESMSPTAASHLPDHVHKADPPPPPEPNVFYTNGSSFQAFWGTAGAADYIVADAQQIMAFANAVYGFEPGLDKIFVVNAPTTEPHQWSFQPWEGVQGPADDPNIPDTSFIGSFLQSGTTNLSGLASVIAVDVTITGSDVILCQGNPFA